MLAKMETLFLQLAVIAIILLTLMITGNVIARAVFSTALPDSIVIVKELMVLAIVMPLAMATATRSHVVVEFLADRFPVRLRGWLIVFGSAVGLFALTPLIYASGRELIHALKTGEYFFGDMDLPKWPGRMAFLAGLILCWLRLAVLVVQDIKALRRGDLAFADSHAIEEEA